jgi:predicted dehydrogenase
MTKLNFGIIGVGGIGKIHVELLKNIPVANLVAIADTNVSLLDEVCKKYHVKGYNDYKQMLEQNKDIDAVYVATPPYTHLQIVKDIIEFRKPVLLEKPIAHNLKDAQKIVEEVKKSKLKMMIGFQKRFNIILREAKKMIEDGIVGEIKMLRISERVSLKTYNKTKGWWCNRSQGGGVIVESSVHAWDLIRWLTGKEITEVFAKGHSYINKEQIYDESFCAILTVGEKITSMVDSTYALPTYSPLDDRIEILGSDGMIYLNLFDQGVMVNSEKGVNIGGAVVKGLTYPDVLQHSLYNGAHKAKLEYFIDCILNEKKPSPDEEDGLKALEVSFAIIDSMEKGQIIKL